MSVFVHATNTVSFHLKRGLPVCRFPSGHHAYNSNWTLLVVAIRCTTLPNHLNRIILTKLGNFLLVIYYVEFVIKPSSQYVRFKNCTKNGSKYFSFKYTKVVFVLLCHDDPSDRYDTNDLTSANDITSVVTYVTCTKVFGREILIETVFFYYYLPFFKFNLPFIIQIFHSSGSSSLFYIWTISSCTSIVKVLPQCLNSSAGHLIIGPH